NTQLASRSTRPAWQCIPRRANRGPHSISPHHRTRPSGGFRDSASAVAAPSDRFPRNGVIRQREKQASAKREPRAGEFFIDDEPAALVLQRQESRDGSIASLANSCRVARDAYLLVPPAFLR